MLPWSDAMGDVLLYWLIHDWYMVDTWLIHGWSTAKHVDFMVHQWICSACALVVREFATPLLAASPWIMLTPMTCSWGNVTPRLMNPGWLIGGVRSICYHNLPLVGSYTYIHTYIHIYICIYSIIIFFLNFQCLIPKKSKHVAYCSAGVDDDDVCRKLWDLTVCQWWVAHSAAIWRGSWMAEGWEPAKMECMIPIYICVCIMCNYSYVFLQIYTSYIQYIYIDTLL